MCTTPYILEYLRTKGWSRTVPKASFDGVVGMAKGLLGVGWGWIKRDVD